MSLPMLSEIYGLTVFQAADLAYPGTTFDAAMPQDCVNALVAHGFDPFGRCVTLYRQGSFGEIAALCVEWDAQLKVALEKWEESRRDHR